MSGNAPNFNTAKLRALLRRRKDASDSVRNLTDSFLDIRDEAGRLQSRIDEKKRCGEQPNQSDEINLASLRDQQQQLQKDRDKAGERLSELDFVEPLIEYAREAGYEVDPERCTVTLPAKRDPEKDHKTRGGGALQEGARRTYL